MRTPPRTTARRIGMSAMMFTTTLHSRGRSGRFRCLSVCAPIMQRAAAEGRKACAEDHTGVDVVGIRYDVVFKRALGLVEHRLHQFAAKTLEFSRVIADLLALRLALIPHVKSFAGFLAELALPHETRQHIVGVGSETKLFSHVIRDVEADQVHPLERAHRRARTAGSRP